jgi:hypothetical protein
MEAKMPFLGTPSAGTFLENFSKLLQIVVVFVGGAWVLVDYFEFAKANKELTNKQLALVNQTAGLTQSSIALNNQITDLKLT